MEMVKEYLTQVQSDIIWAAKGHYFTGSGDFKRFVEHPDAQTMVNIIGTPFTFDYFMSEISELAARAILDADDPIRDFKGIFYYSNHSVMKKVSSMPELISKAQLEVFVKHHQAEFMLVMLATWKIPEHYVLMAPTWEPDKFKKKGKVIE